MLLPSFPTQQRGLEGTVSPFEGDAKPLCGRASQRHFPGGRRPRNPALVSSVGSVLGGSGCLPRAALPVRVCGLFLPRQSLFKLGEHI